MSYSAISPPVVPRVLATQQLALHVQECILVCAEIHLLHNHAHMMKSVMSLSYTFQVSDTGHWTMPCVAQSLINLPAPWSFAPGWVAPYAAGRQAPAQGHGQWLVERRPPRPRGPCGTAATAACAPSRTSPLSLLTSAWLLPGLTMAA